MLVDFIRRGYNNIVVANYLQVIIPCLQHVLEVGTPSLVDGLLKRIQSKQYFPLKTTKLTC